VAKGLRRLGVAPGDVVFFHSSLASLGYVEGGAETVIEGFLEAVGPCGTLAVPVFNLIAGDRKAAWNVKTCPSTVGLVTEAFRLRPDALRSDHYSHSIAAIGPRAAELVADHFVPPGRRLEDHAAFGLGSPFAKLVAWDARYVFLGTDWTTATLLHYVECFFHDRRLAPLDPGIDRVRIERPAMGAALEAAGLGRAERIGPAEVKLFSARGIAEGALELFESAPLRYATEWGARTLAPLLEAHGLTEPPIAWPPG
jgi:aminoglycoside N3'-acetyltransferase